MSEAVHTTRDDLQWSGRLAGSLDRTGVLGRVQLAQPQGRLAAEALVEHSVDERRGLLGGHVGLGGHMALQLTGRRGKERTYVMLCKHAMLEDLQKAGVHREESLGDLVAEAWLRRV